MLQHRCVIAAFHNGLMFVAHFSCTSGNVFAFFADRDFVHNLPIATVLYAILIEIVRGILFVSTATPTLGIKLRVCQLKGNELLAARHTLTNSYQQQQQERSDDEKTRCHDVIATQSASQTGRMMDFIESSL